MPDTAPSISFLKKQKVLPISKEDREAYDAAVREQQKNDPLWKKLAQGGLSATSGGIQGLLGFEPSEDEKKYDPVSSYANLAGQLYGLGIVPWAKAGLAGVGALKAGMPLLAMTKGEQLLHGTKNVFNEIKPELADTSDTLGHMFHTTPIPTYAEDYSLGYIKNRVGQENPNTLAVTAPKAKNVIDLYGEHKNADDIAQLVAQVKDPESKKDLIKNWRKAVRGEDKGMFGHDPINSPTSTRSRFMQNLITHMTPEVTASMPFDAVRYNDAGYEAYAFPHSTELETPWGTPLNNPGKPLTVTKLPHDAPTGTLTTTKHFQSPEAKPTHFMVGGMSPEEIDNLVNKTNASDWVVTNPNGDSYPMSEWKGYGNEASHKATLKDYLTNQHEWGGFKMEPPEGNALTNHPAAYKPKKTIKQMIMGSDPNKIPAPISPEHPYKSLLDQNPKMDFSDWSISRYGDKKLVSEYGAHPETGGNEVARGIINYPDIWHGYELHPPESWVPYGGGSNWQAPTGSAESIIQKAADSTSGKLPSDWAYDQGFGKGGPKEPNPPPHINPYDQGEAYQPPAGYQPGDKAPLFEPKQEPHVNPYDSGPTTQPPAGYHPGVDMSDWDVTTPGGMKLKVKDYGPKADMHDWVTQKIIGQHPGWEGYKLEKPPEEDLSHFFEPEYDDPSNKLW